MAPARGGTDDFIRTTRRDLCPLQLGAPARGLAAQILHDLGVRKMKLLASPRRIPSMTGFDLEVTGYVATPDDLE